MKPIKVAVVGYGGMGSRDKRDQRELNRPEWIQKIRKRFDYSVC